MKIRFQPPATSSALAKSHHAEVLSRPAASPYEQFLHSQLKESKGLPKNFLGEGTEKGAEENSITSPIGCPSPEDSSTFFP
jgi:hypothetical protein